MARRVAAAGLLAVLPPLCAGIPAAPIYLSPGKDGAEVALCSIDVFQGVVSLTRASTAIYWAQNDCRHNRTANSSLQQELCAVGITEVITSLGEAASYLAATGSDCIDGLVEKAYCAADITALLAALGQVANMAASVNLTCGGGKTDLEEEGTVDGRRLQGSSSDDLQASRSSQDIDKFHAMLRGEIRQAAGREEGSGERTEHKEGVSAERQVEITECVLDVSQVVGSLVRAALAIQHAVKKCDPRPEHGGKDSEGANSDRRKRTCAVDIAGVIGSFSFVGEFLSFAVSHCPVEGNVQAECAGNVLQLSAALASFAAVGAAMPLTCNPKVEEFEEGVPPDRRLALNASGDLFV